ncbi:MAG: OmpA family protein [Rhodanobacteraceae bacterium]
MKRKGLCALIALVLGSAGAVSVAHAQDSMTQDTTTAPTTTTQTTTESAPMTSTDTTMQSTPSSTTTTQDTTTTQQETTTTTMTTTDTGYGSWYIVPRIGAAFGDSNRHVNTDIAGGLGVGYWVTPNLTLDIEGLTDNADYDSSSGRDGKQWESDQLDVAARWYFFDPASPWRPYVMGGIGAVRHQAVSGVAARAGVTYPCKAGGISGGVPNAPETCVLNTGGTGWGPMATVGIGILYNINDRIALRGELAARYYRDTTSSRLAGFTETQYPLDASGNPTRIRGPVQHLDGLATVGLVIKLGHAAPPPPAVAPAPADCSTMDSDHDGVNDCNDKCPDTPAGTIVGPDGCPQNVVIDLRGVNFKFDRPKKGETNIGPTLKAPESDSLAILDQAVDTLNRYPQVQIEIDGYTDSVGTDQYNQGLSDRRANIVDGYLTSHGISSSRITAVKGFGETHPIDTNSTAAGRQRNRRVELSVQGQNAAQGGQMPPPPPAETPMEEHHEKMMRHHHRARHHHKAAMKNGATTTTTTTTTEPASAPASSSTSGQ